MDKMKLSTAILALAAMYPLFATADSVIFNGTRYTCTNTCVVTVSNGNYTVQDCCGGRMRFQIQ